MSDRDRRVFLQQATGAVAAVALWPDRLLAAPILRGTPLPVAVIGAGRQGRAMLGELQKMEAVTVAAICDTDPSRLRSGLRRTVGAEGFDDHRALLDRRDDVRAVFVATPTHGHVDVARDVMSSGRHLYCEAPLAHDLDGCRAIVEAARAFDGVVQAGLQARSNPIYRLARSFFRTDAMRDLVSITAQRHRKTSWRMAAPDPSLVEARNWRLDPSISLGLAGEWGTHQFDAVHWFRGRYPVSVEGTGDVRLHRDGRTVPDTIHCRLAFDDGVNLLYGATLANSFGGRNEVFHGSNAAIKLVWTAGWMFKEADAPTMGWEVYANRQQFHDEEGITLIADATKLAAQGRLKEGVGLPEPPLHYALADFLRSVLEDAPVACSVEEGARATAVGILANRAVVSDTRIEIDPTVLEGAS